ncbi:MAG: DUF2283 domain-containing protein [Burkholderiales bacterium]|nr:DUF2283 domain-containing protein [Phycisphaerae bacterium]
MTIKYFEQTDTLYISLRSADVAETRDLDGHTQIDLDVAGEMCAITIEHAKERVDMPKLSFETVAA